MKKLLLLLLLVTINVTAQGNPDKFRDGIKTPFTQYNELTTTQKLALPQVKGTVAFDTDLNELQVYNGTEWVTFGSEINTSDDITEGNTNLFLDVAEREKLNDITFDDNTNNTFLGIGAGDISTGVNITATGFNAARNTTGGNITATGRAAAANSTGNFITATGLSAAADTNGDQIVALGSEAARFSSGSNTVAVGIISGRNAIGNSITSIGHGAGTFPFSNTLQTPNSTAIGANTIIDKANQAAIGDVNVTELKIGETLVVDKAQIVSQPEGVLVTKKVNGKTVVEVKDQDFIYILAEGQSNMLRVTEVGETIYDAEINNNIQLLNSVTNTFEVYNSNRNSIWRDFANKLQKETNKTIRIVLNAYSGNNIEQWLTGSNHTNLITILQNANIESNIFDVFLWHQGESNENQRDYPLKFKQRYDLLVSSGYLKDDVVTVVGELGGFRQSFKDTNTIINSIPDLFLNEKIGVANSYGLDDANIGDGTHYNSYGAWVLGTQRYYEAYNKAKVRVNEVLEPTEKYIHLEKKGATHIVFKNDNFSEFSIEDEILTKVTTFTNSSNTPKILRTYLQKGIDRINPYILLPNKSIQVATTNKGFYTIVKDGNDLDYLELEITSYTVNSSNVKIVEVGTTYNIQVTGKWFTEAFNVFSDKATISNLNFVAQNTIEFDLTPTQRGGVDITLTNGDSAIFYKDFVYTDDVYIENATEFYNTPALIASQLSLSEDNITDFENIGNDVVFKTNTSYTYNFGAFTNSDIIGYFDYDGNATGRAQSLFQGSKGLREFYSNSDLDLGDYCFLSNTQLYRIILNNTTSIHSQFLRYCSAITDLRIETLAALPFGGIQDIPNLNYIFIPNCNLGTGSNYFTGTTNKSNLTVVIGDTTNNNSNTALADIITQGGNVYFGETNAPVLVNKNLAPKSDAVKFWNGSEWIISTNYAKKTGNKLFDFDARTVVLGDASNGTTLPFNKGQIGFSQIDPTPDPLNLGDPKPIGLWIHDGISNKKIWTSDNFGKDNILFTKNIIPSTSTSAGVKNQIEFDLNYVYFCYLDNNWIRIAKDPNW